MPWLKLDDAFWANPKIVEAGNEAAGAYVRMLSYCAQQLTDGHIKESAAKVIANQRIRKRLVDHGLLERNGKGWVIPDFLDFNPSREKVEATRKARSEAGKKGGKASSKGPSK
jgi:hypothetical protein